MQWENVRMNINILGPGPAELDTIPKYTLYIFKKFVFKLWFSDFKTAFLGQSFGHFNFS